MKARCKRVLLLELQPAHIQEIYIPYALHEHYDTVFCVGYMEGTTIYTEDVKKQMMKIKDNKAYCAVSNLHMIVYGIVP